MKVGDLVVYRWREYDYRINPIGIILKVDTYEGLCGGMSTPWLYRVLWGDGVVKEHEQVSLREVWET